jgi:hypothetical protein
MWCTFTHLLCEFFLTRNTKQGYDDDCDGSVDEVGANGNAPGAGKACNTGIADCPIGETQCVEGDIVCEAPENCEAPQGMFRELGSRRHTLALTPLLPGRYLHGRPCMRDRSAWPLLSRHHRLRRTGRGDVFPDQPAHHRDLQLDRRRLRWCGRRCCPRHLQHWHHDPGMRDRYFVLCQWRHAVHPAGWLRGRRRCLGCVVTGCPCPDRSCPTTQRNAWLVSRARRACRVSAPPVLRHAPTTWRAVCLPTPLVWRPATDWMMTVMAPYVRIRFRVSVPH